MKLNKDNLNICPNSVSIQGTEIILKQMKSNICKICIGKKIIGTGFFCNIPINNNLFPVLITNNHIINESILKKETIISLLINNHSIKEIELDNRLIYTNIEYDITIIEIKEKDNIKDFLELDNIKRNNKSYIGESISIRATTSLFFIIG